MISIYKLNHSFLNFIQSKAFLKIEDLFDHYLSSLHSKFFGHTHFLFPLLNEFCALSVQVCKHSMYFVKIMLIVLGLVREEFPDFNFIYKLYYSIHYLVLYFYLLNFHQSVFIA
jgi:hypothetical protein